MNFDQQEALYSTTSDIFEMFLRRYQSLSDNEKTATLSDAFERGSELLGSHKLVDFDNFAYLERYSRLSDRELRLAYTTYLTSNVLKSIISDFYLSTEMRRIREAMDLQVKRYDPRYKRSYDYLLGPISNAAEFISIYLKNGKQPQMLTSILKAGKIEVDSFLENKATLMKYIGDDNFNDFDELVGALPKASMCPGITSGIVYFMIDLFAVIHTRISTKIKI